jgi:hypothetical protein
LATDSEDHLVVKIEAGVNGHGFFNLQEEASSQALGSASLSPGDKWFRPRLQRGRLQVELQLLRRVQGTRLIDLILF